MAAITEATKNKIVRLYERGDTIDTIERECRVARPTVFKVLKQRNIPLNRLGSPNSGQPSVAELLTALREQLAAITGQNTGLVEMCARLERENTELRAMNAQLMEVAKGATRPARRVEATAKKAAPTRAHTRASA